MRQIETRAAGENQVQAALRRQGVEGRNPLGGAPGAAVHAQQAGAAGARVDRVGGNGEGMRGALVDLADLFGDMRPGIALGALAPGLAQGELRDIAWMLEGTGIALLVTPAPADLQELPSVMRPVAGLPLLYLDR